MICQLTLSKILIDYFVYLQNCYPSDLKTSFTFNPDYAIDFDIKSWNAIKISVRS